MKDVNNLQICIIPEYIHKALDRSKDMSLDKFGNAVYFNKVGPVDGEMSSDPEPLNLMVSNREEIKKIAKWMVKTFSKADIMDFFICNGPIYFKILGEHQDFRAGLRVLADEICELGIPVSLEAFNPSVQEALQDFLSLYSTAPTCQPEEDKLISMRNTTATDASIAPNQSFHIVIEENVLYVIPQQCFGMYFSKDLKNFRSYLSSEILDHMIAYYGEESALKSNVFKLWNNICNL